MLYFPFGIFPNDVVSPEKLANEFQEANRVASKCTQYQFTRTAFEHEHIEEGSHVAVEYAVQEASLELKPASGPTLTGGDRWQVPYDRGLEEIDLDWPEWTSVYPELVFATFNFQYARTEHASQNIRTAIRLLIDGATMPGAGPMSTSVDGLNRGTGLGCYSAFSSIHAMAVLPAGTHRVSAEAGQRNSLTSTRDAEAKHDVLNAPPTTNVMIGNRSCLVLRFARGGELDG